MKAPRNFTLDPQVYGRPEPAGFLAFYPAMRAATVMVAILFVIVLVAQFLNLDSGAGGIASEPIAMQVADEAAQAEEVVEEAEAPLAAEQLPAPVEVEPVAEMEVMVEEEVVIEAPAEESDPLQLEAPAEEAVETEAYAALTPEAEEAIEEEMVEGEAEMGRQLASPESTPSLEVQESSEGDQAVSTQRPPGGGGGEPPQTPVVDEPAVEDEAQGTEVPFETATVEITSSPSPIIEPTIAEQVASSAQASPDFPREEPIDEVPEVAEEPVKIAQESAPVTFLQQLIIILAIALITLAFVTIFLRRQLNR